MPELEIRTTIEKIEKRKIYGYYAKSQWLTGNVLLEEC